MEWWCHWALARSLGSGEQCTRMNLIRPPRWTRFVTGLLALGFLSMIVALGINALSDSQIDSRDEVLLFATDARKSNNGAHWEIPVHGWVFQPGQDSALQATVTTTLRSALGLGADEPAGSLFEDRVRSFLFDNERDKHITVRVAGHEHRLGPTDPSGHFEAMIEVPANRVAAETHELTIEAISPVHPAGRFQGKVLLIPPRGLSVISDIDDTVKVTQVTDRRELLRNTFMRPFAAVQGMAPFYQRLASAGAVFHYVSSSPWQLYPALTAFLHQAGFPPATLHLKRFRPKDTTVLDLFADPLETKVPAIRALMARHPGRSFVLVGDSGEKDPEVYGSIAREAAASGGKTQVVAILIRNVTNEPVDSPRMTAAFAGLPRPLWQVFTDPAELAVPTPP